jgi:beta-carotene ketolase (CrtW type)
MQGVKAIMRKSPPYVGVLIAAIVILGWLTSTVLLMGWEFSWTNPLLYFFILLQMHLYTGLFITAHDAMHGTVSRNRPINNAIGYIATFFYAAFTANTISIINMCIPRLIPTIIMVTF